MTDNFIGIYPNGISVELCKDLVATWDRAEQTSHFMPTNNLGRKDDAFGLVDVDRDMNQYLNNELNNAVSLYRKEYPVIEACALKSYSNKMQRTEIGGGYHDWHFEQSGISVSSRLLTWLVYLNDVAEGGETEFLYQGVRVQPKTGTLVVCQASFTHTHRGNPPLSNTKYVVTGWYNFY